MQVATLERLTFSTSLFPFYSPNYCTVRSVFKTLSQILGFLAFVFFHYSRKELLLIRYLALKCMISHIVQVVALEHLTFSTPFTLHFTAQVIAL